MPTSAIAAGCVDIAALPADMPARIAGVIGAQAPTGLPPAERAGHATAALDTILVLLHEHTRHDLALYKSNTLVRRIARRVAVHGLDSMAAYADFLRTNSQERDLLFKEMLIGVTLFFRDAQVWQDLQDKVLPVLMERHADGSGPLRAWVVGCSTGEEAYSLAIAFTEALDAWPAPVQCRLQTFATDLNADAIASARTGRFAATIVGDLTPQRLSRFFSERRPATRPASQETALPDLHAPAANLQSLADHVLLQSFSPPAVLVNDAGEIVYVSGRTGRYLEAAAGKTNWNIHVMARPSIRAQLAVALRTAVQDKTTVELRALRLDDDDAAAVDITVQAVVQPSKREGLAMIVFRDVPAAASRGGRRTKSPGRAEPGLTEERGTADHQR